MPKVNTKQVPQGVTPVEKKRTPWLIIVLTVLVVIGLGLLAYQYNLLGAKSTITNNKEGIVADRGGDSVVDEDLPFKEMTIPYLRQKSYDSELGPLEPVGQNGIYNSYLTYFTSEGLKVNGLLLVPSGEEPEGGWPAIVFIHGYIPPSIYQTQGQYADYIDYLARNGFVVFKIDLRGHAESEGGAGGGYFGSDYVTDALSAYTALSDADFVNPKNVGFWGHSMAGNIVMRSMASKPEVPAAVIWAGAVYSYVDRDKYGIDDNSYRPPADINNRSRNRRQLMFEKHGSPSAQSVFWRQVAPTSYLSDLKGAIQLNHAVDDDVVNVGYSRDLVALLEKTDVPHELIEYPSGGHNISGGSFVQAMQNTVDFFKEHLSN